MEANWTYADEWNDIWTRMGFPMTPEMLEKHREQDRRFDALMTRRKALLEQAVE